MENLKNFENIYILKGSMPEEEAKKEMEEIKKYFENVTIYKKENGKNGFWGLKNLAYEIKKEKTGYYYTTHFKATNEKVENINKKLFDNENVLKYITIKIDDEV